MAKPIKVLNLSLFSIFVIIFSAFLFSSCSGGNTGGISANQEKINDPILSKLNDTIKKGDSLHKSDAIKNLSVINTKEAAVILGNVILKDPDEAFRRDAIYAISSYYKKANPEAIKYLVKAAINDKSENIRTSAVGAIGSSKLDNALEEIKALSKENDEATKAMAVFYAGVVGGPENDSDSKKILSELLKNDPSPKVRAYAASGLGYFKTEDSVALIVPGLKDSDRSVRNAALSSIYMLSYNNIVDRAVIPDIITALHDEYSGTRYTASMVLGYYGDKSVGEELSFGLKDIYSDVRTAAGNSLEKLGLLKNPADYGISVPSQENIINELIRLTQKGDKDMKLSVVSELGKIHDKKAVGELIKFLNDNDKDIRKAAVSALGDYNGPKDKTALDHIIKILRDDESEDVRNAAASILDDFGDKRAIYPLMDSLKKDSSKNVRSSILYTVRTMDDQSTIDVISEVIKNDPDLEVRGIACYALGGFKNAAAVNTLINIIEESDLSYVRAKAAEALGDYFGAKDTRAIEPIKKLLNDEYPVARQSAAKALYYLNDKSVGDSMTNSIKGEKYPLVRIEMIKTLGSIASAANTGIFIDILRASSIEDERLAVINAFDNLNNTESINPLIDLLQNDHSDKVRAQAANALYGFNDMRLLSPLINAMLNDKAENVRFEAAETLNYMKDKSAFNAFLAVMNKKDESVRIVAEAAGALGNMEDPRAVDALIKLYGATGSSQVDARIIYALSVLKDTRALDIYLSGIKSGDKSIREAAMKALETLSLVIEANPDMFNAFLEGLKDASPDIRQISARALGAYRDMRAKDALIKTLSDENKWVRYYGAMALGNLGVEESSSSIFPLLKNENTKYAAEQALKMLGFSENDISSGAPSGNDYIAELVSKARSADWSTSYYAFNDLSYITTKRALDELLNMLDSPAGIGAPEYLVSALANYKGPRNERVYDAFVEILNSSGDENMRRAVSGNFSYLKDKRAVDILVNVMKNDASDSVKVGAASSLGNMNDIRAVDPLIEAINSDSPSLRSAAASALGNLYSISGDNRITDNMVRLLADKDFSVVSSAVYALGNIQDKKTIGPLKNLLKDKNESIRNAAESSLKRLGVSDDEIKGAGLTNEELFNEYVGNIKNSPYYWNRPLREKIISLSREISPAPVITDEVDKYMAQAKAAFDMAKTEEGLLDAIEKYKKAATLAPWWPSAYFNLAMVQLKARYYDDAKENFEIYLIASPTAEDADKVKQKIYEMDYIKERMQKAAELVNAGYIYIEAKDFYSAIPKFEEALKLDPDSAWAHYELGYSYSGLEKYDEAIKELKEAIRLNPKDLSFYLSLGYAYGMRGDNDMCIETYEKGLSEDPYGKNRIYVLINLANKYKNKGDYKRAKELYEQASWSTEDHPDKDKIQGWISEVSY